MNNIKIFTILFSISFLGFVVTANAYVASSSNYRIDKHSVNMGGLDTSSSSSYLLKDTIGETGTGTSSSATYKMRAGYRQMEEGYLSMSAESSISLSPDISGLTGGSATGEGTWTVSTDSATGYNMTIRTTTSPAMQSGANNFADYTPVVVGTPDHSWAIGSANSEFGFSPYNSASQVDKYKNNGTSCNTGSGVTDEKCWYGLSTTNETVVDRSSRTSAGGDDTVINFQAEVNTSGSQTAGSYTATVEVTAISN